MLLQFTKTIFTAACVEAAPHTDKWPLSSYCLTDRWLQGSAVQRKKIPLINFSGYMCVTWVELI